jgi:phosphohistidine phosphatase SixA
VADQQPGPVRAGLVPWRRDEDGRVAVGLVRAGRGCELPARLVAGDHPLAAALAAAPPGARFGPPGPHVEVGGQGGRGGAPGGWFWPVEVLGGHESLDWRRSDEVEAGADQVLAAVVKPDGLGAVRQAVLVRHARAGQRSQWEGPDAERPLDERGRAQAAALAGLLTAYAVERIHSSDSRRCLETVGPLGAALGLPVLAEPLLSEDGSARDPAAAGQVLSDLVARPGQAVVCTQRKTLDRVMGELLTGLGIEAGSVDAPRKGGLLVLHLPVDARGTASVEALGPPPS